jgi:hypothetical protein
LVQLLIQSLQHSFDTFVFHNSLDIGIVSPDVGKRMIHMGNVY